MRTRFSPPSVTTLVVLEEHQTIGVPVHCTGLFGLEAFSEFDIPRDVRARHGRRRRVRRRRRQRPLSSPPIRCGRSSSIARASIRSLADASRQAGAELRSGSRVRAITVESHHVALTFDDQPPVQRASMRAGVRRQLSGSTVSSGLGVPRAFVQSAQLEWPFAGPERVEVHLGREVAPAGFAWLVPFTRAGQRFNRIGLMCETRAAPRDFARSRGACATGSVCRRAGPSRG